QLAQLAGGDGHVGVEAGIRMGWDRYAGPHALYITMETFGASGPAKAVAAKFGFTAENIVAKVIEFLSKK
ncbi:MAG TPA: transketolase, partial [Spirochaetota bacterium]|nr:transketolase [Spirochaetota bacterium]